MIPTGTDKSTIQIVLVAITTITVLLFAGAFVLLYQGKDATVVALMLSPASLGLGGLLAMLNNTRTAAGAVPPAPELAASPADTQPAIVDVQPDAAPAA